MDVEQHTEHVDRVEPIEHHASLRAGIFAWPSLRREIEHACVAAGVARPRLRVKWRGLGVHVDITVVGDALRVRRMARFIDDIAAQA